MTGHQFCSASVRFEVNRPL